MTYHRCMASETDTSSGTDPLVVRSLPRPDRYGAVRRQGLPTDTTSSTRSPRQRVSPAWTCSTTSRSKEDLALQRPVRTGRADRRPLRRAPGRRGPVDIAGAAFQVLEEIDTTRRAPARDDHAAVRQRVPARRARREAGSLARPVRTADRAATTNSERCTLQARAIAAAAITCLQVANEEWVRLGGQVDLFDLYDEACADDPPSHHNQIRR